MSRDADPIEMLGEAMKDARKDFMEKFFRPMRTEIVNRPLLGKKRSKDELRARFFQLRNDPALLASERDYLVERYKVPEGMIGVRLWDYLAAGEREFGKEGE